MLNKCKYFIHVNSLAICISAGWLESAYRFFRGAHSILGNGGGEPLAVL